MKSRLKDPDLARMFENTFPNTLGPSLCALYPFQRRAYVRKDTTVRYYNEVGLPFIFSLCARMISLEDREFGLHHNWGSSS